jgi:serine/threonine-protein kinase
MTPLTPERLAQLGRHFDTLVDLPEDARESALAALAGDPELLRELRAMLAADRKPLDLANAVVRQYGDDRVPDRDDDSPAAPQYGPWRVLGELGRGGMGVVHAVERQIDGHVQRAALKRLRHRCGDVAAAARFLQERTVLMRLAHPHIARFLDAGTEMDGASWLVMERVDGLPLLEWCARRRSPLAERLRLFTQLCGAVQHAHRHAVVHRDIKPGNVLVDDAGELKLLDFGIAKLVGDEAATRATGSASTADGPMTPQYAAPEQLRGQAVTTQTDVYGLGAVLYELVCGQRPYAQVGDAAPVACARVLGNTPCRPASDALVDSPDLAGLISPRALKGDLDLIVLKALAREPERRYGSVDALLDDLGRYRSGHPIRAREGAWLYVARAFVRRHLTAVVSVAVVAASLVASSVVSWRAADAARAEAERAEAAQAYLLSVFDAADPGTYGGFKVTARDLVAAGAQRLATAYTSQPELRAEAALTIGRVQLRLGDAVGAVEQLRWEDTRDGALPGADRRLTKRLIALGQAQLLVGSLDAAEASARRVLASAQAEGHGAWTGQALSLLSEIARKRGRRDEAVKLGEQAARAVRDSADVATAVDVLFQYTNVLREVDALDAARAVGEQALAMCEAAPEHCRHRIAIARIQLAPIQRRQGDDAGARAGLEAALAELGEWLPESHPRRIDALSLLAALDGDAGRHDDAIAAARTVVTLQRAADGGDSVTVGGYMNALGGRYGAAGRDVDALATYREAVIHFERIGQPEHPYALAARGNLATTLSRLGQHAEALTLATSTLEASRRISGHDAATTLSKAVQLLRVQVAAGEYDAARMAAMALTRVLSNSTLAPATVVALSMATAEALVELGDADGALTIVDRAHAVGAPLYTRQPLLECALLTRRADALRIAGQIEESRASAKAAVAIADRVDPAARDRRSPEARIALAQALARTPAGSDAARALLARAVTEFEALEGPESRRSVATRALLAALPAGQR